MSAVDVAAPHQRDERGHWRPDIQGLRAVAVVAVIAYHAGLPVPGGFVGVDIFFVISGFVITGMLLRQWQSTATLRLARFYWRRFLRLTPALGAMVAATLLGSLMLQSPLGAQETTALTGIGAMLLTANIVIALTTGDYFDAPAAANPLLHTWSLSVEEQFYLIFPLTLLLALGLRRGPARAFQVTLGIAAVSFAAALVSQYIGVGPRTDWLIGYYGPLSRAWEFAVGALLAMPALARSVPTGRKGTILAGAGVVAVTASLWLISDTTPFPGAWTLLPVLGTAAVIHGAGAGGPVARVLGSRPLVAIGDRSYSLYLWHWPVIVFALVIWPFGTGVAAWAALASFVPAVISYRFVEDPLRRRGAMRPKSRGLLVAFVVGIPLLLAVLLLAASSLVLRPMFEAGRWAGTNAGSVGQDDFRSFFDTHARPCSLSASPPQPTSPAGTALCNESAPGQPLEVLILGDSHAAQLFPALAESLPNDNVAFLDTLGVPSLDESASGNAWIRDVIASQPDLRAVILTAAWYARGVPGPEMDATIEWLRSRGLEVVLVADTPDFPFDAAVCKFPRSILLSPQCSIPRNEYDQARTSSQQALAGLAARHEVVTLIDPLPLFCAGDACSMASQGEMLYRDLNHLNEAGARRLASLVVPALPPPLRADRDLGER